MVCYGISGVVNTQEKLETMIMQNLGVNKVHYGLCEIGE